MTDRPPIAGREAELLTLMRQDAPIWRTDSNLELARMRSGFACALHMHQPTIPAGSNGALISHLQYMVEHQGEGDNHNAEPFAQCYRRLADLIPQLISEDAIRGSCSITQEICSGACSRWDGTTSAMPFAIWPATR